MYILRKVTTYTVDEMRDFEVDERLMERLYTYLGEILDEDSFEDLPELTPDDVAAIWADNWDKKDYIVWKNSPFDDDDPYEVELYFVVYEFLDNEFNYIEGEDYYWEKAAVPEGNGVYWED